MSMDDGKSALKYSKPIYKCASHVKEQHSHELYCIAINNYIEPTLIATAGGPYSNVYECLEDGNLNLLQCYKNENSSEFYYTCVWATTTSKDGQPSPRLCVAGELGIIRVIDVTDRRLVWNLLGHGSSINDIKVHSTDSNLIISASKDRNLIIWNLSTGIPVVKCSAGLTGHTAEIVNCDINLSGDELISCGIDHSIKIWIITDTMKEYIARSYTHKSNKTAFKIYTQFNCDYSTSVIHSNYVDCCRWLGDLILSKSCEDEIVLWKPGLDEGEGNKKYNKDLSPTIFSHLAFENSDIWFLKFSLDYYLRILVTGNISGKLYLWELATNDHVFSSKDYTVLSDPQCTKAIRQTVVSRDGNTILCCCADATIWRWERVNKLEEPCPPTDTPTVTASIA